MKLIDLILEEVSEKEKQVFLKKSRIIYKLHRKRTYNNYGVKFSWVLSDEAEFNYEYDYYTNKPVAIIYPKDVQIKLYGNNKVIDDYESGNIPKKDFLFIIGSYIEPIVNIKLSIKNEDDIHITKEEDQDPNFSDRS